MDWSQVLTIFGGNIALFLWSTRQIRSHFLQLNKKIEDDRKETNQLIKAIHEEMKDFHNRLCEIEERKKQEGVYSPLCF